MPTTTVPRFRAVMLLDKNKIAPLLSSATVVTTAMAAEVVTFPLPVPSLAIVLGQINSLQTAQNALASGIRGTATAVRNRARDALWTSLVSLKTYVQSVADVSEDNSFMIVKSSGFTVRGPVPRIKPVLEAKVTTSGVVNLTANAKALAAGSKGRATYNWQYSVDGGHTWLSVISTPVANTTIVALPTGTICSFRVSVTQKQTMQPWSQVVSIPVH